MKRSTCILWEAAFNSFNPKLYWKFCSYAEIHARDITHIRVCTISIWVNKITFVWQNYSRRWNGVHRCHSRFTFVFSISWNYGWARPVTHFRSERTDDFLPQQPLKWQPPWLEASISWSRSSLFIQMSCFRGPAFQTVTGLSDNHTAYWNHCSIFPVNIRAQFIHQNPKRKQTQTTNEDINWTSA